MGRIPKSRLERKDERELKKLAMDIHAGAVFTDRHLPRPEDASMVFMVLGLMDRKHRLDMIRKDRPGMIYEYMSAASPRSVNGMPTFFSMRMLHPDDTQIVWKFYEEMAKELGTTTEGESSGQSL